MNIRRVLMMAVIPVIAHATPFWHLIDSSTNTPHALVYVIPHPTTETIAHESWRSFHTSAFDIIHFLNEARVKNIPAIFVIPDSYKHLSTTQDEAPILEGARVALAWASTYFRFKETDTRILLCPASINTCECLAQISALSSRSFTFKNGADRDEQIYHRIISYHDLPHTKSSSCHLEPYPISLPETSLHHIPSSRATMPSMKRVLITGGSGFIGSHLSRWFIDHGYHVISLDNLSCSTTKNNEDLLKNPHFEFHQHDVSQPFTIAGDLDIVAHLAALPSPAYYYVKPIESMVAGLHGTKITLDLAREKKARYLFASTSEVYGDPKVHPQPETYPGLVDPIGKRSQYDQSKRGAETLIKLYFEKYGMDVRIIRIFNTYGPGMQLGDGRVVTNFIRAALEHKPMTIYGTGEQTRSLCYITDNIDAITRIITNDEITTIPHIKDRIFNVGNPEEYTINDVARYVNNLSIKYLGHSATITKIPQFDQTDPKVRRPDLTRTMKQTGYIPRVSFEEGLEKIFLDYFHAIQHKTY